LSGDSEPLDFPATTARVHTFDNGLEVIVKEDRSAPAASVQAWCRAGSIHEGEWLGAGLSHFLEHMLFKGTGRRDATEIARTVQAAGGYINAYTAFDRTVFWIDTPAAGVETCLDVLCDVVGDATLPEEEFAREADVIRREIAMGEDDPDRVLFAHLFRTAYAEHPARQPVIGHRDLFDQLERDDLYAYYREKYSPDNVFLVVVGDVDADSVIELVGSRLGALPRRKRGPVALPDEPPLLGVRRDDATFPTDLHRQRLAWPAPAGHHADVPALDLAVSILGEGRSSRLYRAIREERRLAHSVGAFAFTPSFPGQVVVSLDTQPEKAAEAEAATFEEIARFLGEGVTPEELEKAVKRTLSAQFSTLTDMGGQASDLGSNWLFTRNLDYTRDYVRAVQEVDADAVTRVARRYLTPSSHTSVSLTPEGVKKAPPAARGTSRSDDIRKVVLDNGLTVLLLADRRLPLVQTGGVFRGGLLAETAGDNGITRLMSRLLVKDTQRRSAAELASAIESVGGAVTSSLGNNTFGVSVQGMRPDLERIVDLLGETLVEPAFLEETLAGERDYQLAQIQSEADRPISVAMKRLRREIYGEHPYGLEPSGTEETVASLGRDRVSDLHHRLVRGGNGVAAVFGDLDTDRAEALVRERFASLPAGEREFVTPLEFDWPARCGQVVEMEHEKEQAVLLIGCRTVDLTHPDDPALELIDEACSDMASRLFIRIREELGLAYSVGATRLPGLEPGMIVFYVSTAPEKLDRVQDEMIDEIESMRREGLAEEEFERAKASWLGRELVTLQGVKELASVTTVDELVGLGWDNYRRTPDRVRALTPDHVRDVAARYLGEENRVIVRLTRG